jgi:hypothetical protein
VDGDAAAKDLGRGCRRGRGDERRRREQPSHRANFT